jgi:SAM-dependent methyltransferase
VKNAAAWQPSKFVEKNGRLRGSRSPSALSVSSRLSADIVASLYERHVPTFARGRLLDLGCGNVPLFGLYRRFVSEAVCVDWGNSLHINQFLDFECDLTRPLPFAASEFDTIILSDVLEHIPEPLDLCKEMARVLRQGGYLIMNVPFFYLLHEQPHDYYRYSEFALRRFGELAGLIPVELITTGGVPEILTDVTAKTIVSVPLVGPAFAAFLQWITSGFIKTKPGRRLSTQTGRRFPFGYFMVARKA